MTKILDIATANDAMQAHFWVSVLSREGIDAHVSNESLHLGIGQLPPGPATNPSILVREEDADRARQILAELRDPQLKRVEPDPPTA